MLICASANPAIDKRVQVKKLLPGKVNRVTGVEAAPGGKAAHVAMVLRALGTDPCWVGFVGGPGGQQLEEGLRRLGIRTVAVPIDHDIRSNLEILGEDGSVTEILEPGPAISEQQACRFRETCADLMREQGSPVTVILSGSLPPGPPATFYREMIEDIHGMGGEAFLDTSGKPLETALPAHPDFVKPNREEAEWLTQAPISDEHSASSALDRLVVLGAQSAAVTLGEAGLLWKPFGKKFVYKARPPKLTVRSGVGSGDATLAGFAYARQAGLSDEESIRLAAACGAANCLAKLPGQVQADEVRKLKSSIEVTIAGD
jgi:tagatose 6-phosphate kinase